MFYASNICYCGSPEPLDFGETGMHGIIYGEMDSKLKLTFRDISKGIFINGEIKIDENINYLTLKDMILKRYKNKNKKVFLKLTLTELFFIHLLSINLNTAPALRSLSICITL